MPDHGELAARRHVEIHSVQYLPARIVTELHRFEGDAGAGQLQRHRIGRIGDFG